MPAVLPLGETGNDFEGDMLSDEAERIIGTLDCASDSHDEMSRLTGSSPAC